jgi:SnoaL-like domain
MDREGAQAWLDRYVAAWRSYDRDEVADLFSPDVAYRYHPYDEPVTGRDAVVASWLGEQGDGPASGTASTRDAPGTYDAHYAPVAVDGDTVVATGRSTYRDTPVGPVVQVYENCFVIRFDGHGRCREFTEYFIERPAGR